MNKEEDRANRGLRLLCEWQVCASVGTVNSSVLT